MKKIVLMVLLVSVAIFYGCSDDMTGGAVRSIDLKSSSLDGGIAPPAPTGPVCGDGVTETDELCDYSNQDDPYTIAGVCTLGCSVDGTTYGWRGCRGNGAAVCTEKVPVGDDYWTINPLCVPNPTCANKFYPCNDIICPDPTDVNGSNTTNYYCGDGLTTQDELCDASNPNDPYVLAGVCTGCTVNGDSNGWDACRGNGVAVCTEKVPIGDSYWNEHPLCVPNPTCSGSFYPCNNICPEPWNNQTTTTTTTTTSTTNPTTTTIYNGTNETCTDSDGGRMYYVFGSVVAGGDNYYVENYQNYYGQPIDGTNEILFNDYCRTDGIRMVEFYCVDNYGLAPWYYDCPNGCENGACLTGNYSNQTTTTTTSTTTTQYQGDTTPPWVEIIDAYAQGNTAIFHVQVGDSESEVIPVAVFDQNNNNRYYQHCGANFCNMTIMFNLTMAMDHNGTNYYNVTADSAGGTGSEYASLIWNI